MSRQFTRPRPTIAVPSVAAPEIADYDSRNASFTHRPDHTRRHPALPVVAATSCRVWRQLDRGWAVARRQSPGPYRRLRMGGSLLRAPWPTSGLPVRRRRLRAGDLWLRAFIGCVVAGNRTVDLGSLIRRHEHRDSGPGNRRACRCVTAQRTNARRNRCRVGRRAPRRGGGVPGSRARACLSLWPSRP